MTVTNTQSGTSVDQIADGLFRISTPVQLPFGGFTFNQYLIVDEAPLLFHTGPRRMFALTKEAIESVLPIEKLRYIGLSHFEADECGALNEFLAVAPNAVPLCGRIAAMTSIGDVADRPGTVLADGEELSLGTHTVRWYDTPHLPHGWECGYLFDTTNGALLCGDLFTQPGADGPPLTTGDVLGPSEAMRHGMEYYAHGTGQRPLLTKLASANPTTLAIMHGSAWQGDGSSLLMALADALEQG